MVPLILPQALNIWAEGRRTIRQARRAVTEIWGPCEFFANAGNKGCSISYAILKGARKLYDAKPNARKIYDFIARKLYDAKPASIRRPEDFNSYNFWAISFRIV